MEMKLKFLFHPGMGKNPSGAGQVNSPGVGVVDFVVEIVEVEIVVVDVVEEAAVVLAVV